MHTLLLRVFLSRCNLSAVASMELPDILLKKVGSEYLFRQDPGPPASNLIGKAGEIII